MNNVSETDSAALVWFRRDLRDDDHAALYWALKHFGRVYCCFVFDTDILDELPRSDRRVAFIHESVVELHEELNRQGGALICRHGRAPEQIPLLAVELGVTAVYCNHDYDPAASFRDAGVSVLLSLSGIEFRTYKDQVIFEREEVLTQAGRAFSVFTPYKAAWLKKVSTFYLSSYAVAPYRQRLARPAVAARIPSLEELGFEASALHSLNLPCGMRGARALFADFQDRLDDYHEQRDFPAKAGVSYLSTHLRFGTISIREVARFAHDRIGPGAQSWLSELIWRDFYQQILFHRPDVVTRNWRSGLEHIEWETGPEAERLFQAWCDGQTGYPLIDAAMRQLTQTGYMHNRLRMLTASFLTKDLGIHWLRGERYFARQLNDYELASNNGGWQWAASTGCDAQPWFRIFNPITQSQKFDPHGHFIRRYLPELAAVPPKFIHAPWTLPTQLARQSGLQLGINYPRPIVDHAQARQRTLARFEPARRTKLSAP